MQSTSAPNNRRSGARTIRGLIVAVLFVAMTVFAVLHRQYIYDTVQFWSYQPTSGIAAVATRAGLSDAGLFAFYTTHPELDGSQSFNTKCDRKEQNTAVIGCYVNDRIYLYDVTDSKLDGVKEVTAVHEMLHAVYQRMDQSERDRINALVEVEYEKLRQDPALSERMAFYDRTEPGERDNELHSIIGTEVGSISSELEAHYKIYLKDRSKVVALYQSYNQEFTSLAMQKDELSSRLDDLSGKISSQTASYNQSARAVESDIESFNTRAQQGTFTSQSQFASERASLVARVNNLTTERSAINDLIAEFNDLRNEYNQTVTESNQLYESLDSNLAPAPKV